MQQLISRLLARHDPRTNLVMHLKAAAGAMFGVTLVGGLAALTSLPLLMAPLGPTSVLMFAQPSNASAQPANVFGGYFIAAVFGAAAELLMPGVWWAATLAVGLAMALMLVLRVTHPPAAAVPLVLLASPMEPLVLFGIMFASCLLLVAIAILHHRLPPRSVYPHILAAEEPDDGDGD